MQNMITSPVPTKVGSLENHDAFASSCFTNGFSVPFQDEVSGHEHGPHIVSYENAVPQAESWQSLSHPPSHPEKPLGPASSLNSPQSRKEDLHQQELPFELPPPLPLRKDYSSSVPRHNDRGRRQKQQPAMSPPSLGNISMVSSAPLPDDFTPRKWSVLVGRDKKCVESPGNKRLHVIIGWYLQRYAKSHDDKEEKSRIISEIESTVRSACQDEEGAFVRYSNGRWREVDPSQVREKIGRMLREALHTNYSSSSKQKRAKLRLLRRVSCN